MFVNKEKVKGIGKGSSFFVDICLGGVGFVFVFFIMVYSGGGRIG